MYKKLCFLFLLIGTIVVSSAASVNAQEKKTGEAMKAEMMATEKQEDTRPIVAIIKADWCPYCKRVDPVVMSLMEDYSEKLNFVMFDVTNEETSAAAMKKASELGLSEFFKKFKGKTSTVAVLKEGKIVYKTSNNADRKDYVSAFESALE